MASKKKAAASAGATLWTLKDSPAIRRLIEDPELRANLVQAYGSTRDAYGRLSSGKRTSKQVFDDKKLHKDVAKAAEALRDASEAMRQGPKRRKGGLGLGKLLVVTLLGAGAALGLSEGLRKKVLDALFGAEEEFEYTSATSPATPSTPATATTGTPTPATGATSTTTATTSTTTSPTTGEGNGIGTSVT